MTDPLTGWFDEWALWVSDTCPRNWPESQWRDTALKQQRGERWPKLVTTVELEVLGLPEVRRKALVSYYCSTQSLSELARSLNISTRRFLRLVKEARTTVEFRIIEQQRHVA